MCDNCGRKPLFYGKEGEPTPVIPHESRTTVPGGSAARPGLMALSQLLEGLTPGDLFPGAEARRRDYEKWLAEQRRLESQPEYVRPTRGELKGTMGRKS